MELKQFRVMNKLSQSEIAELFGCSQGHISALESGVRNITALHIRLLIEKYGFESVEPYIEESDKMPSPTSININAPKISDNSAPVNAGSGTQNVSTDDKLIELLKKKDEQIDRLISLIENKLNN